MPIPTMKFVPFDPSKPIEIRFIQPEKDRWPNNVLRERSKGDPVIVARNDGCRICKEFATAKSVIIVPVYSADQTPGISTPCSELRIYPHHKLYPLAESGKLQYVQLGKESTQPEPVYHA